MCTKIYTHVVSRISCELKRIYICFTVAANKVDLKLVRWFGLLKKWDVMRCVTMIILILSEKSKLPCSIIIGSVRLRLRWIVMSFKELLPCSVSWPFCCFWRRVSHDHHNDRRRRRDHDIEQSSLMYRQIMLS